MEIDAKYINNQMSNQVYFVKCFQNYLAFTAKAVGIYEQE